MQLNQVATLDDVTTEFALIKMLNTARNNAVVVHLVQRDYNFPQYFAYNDPNLGRVGEFDGHMQIVEVNEVII